MKKLPLFFIMSSSYRNPIKGLFYLSFFFLISLSALRQIVSLDIFFHLKTGEWIWHNLSVPKTQLYSFILGSKEWIDHEWLFQSLVYPIFKFLGYNGLILLRYTIVCIICFIFYLLVRDLKKYAGWALTIILLSFIIACNRFTVRPHLFSLLFVSIFIGALKNYKGRKTIFLLIFIQIIWSNMHGYFILGPAVTGLFLISRVISNKVKLPFSWNSNRIKNKEFNTLIVFFIVLLFSTLASPYFFKNLLYPLDVIYSTLNGSGRYAFEFIAELESIDMPALLDTAKGQSLHMLIILFFLTCFLNLKRLDIFDVFITIGFFSLSLIAIRHVDLFAISTAMLSIGNLKSAEGDSPLFIKQRLAVIFNRAIPIIGNIIALFLIIYQIKMYAGFLNYKYVYDLKGSSKSIFLNRNESNIDYADDAARFIKEHGIRGNVFNHHNTGHYMIFSLYPDCRVFIDGRTEVYGDRILQLSVASFFDPCLITELSGKYNFDCILWPSNSTDESSRVFKYLYNSRDWKLVFFDFKAGVFLKDVPENYDLIKRYKVDLTHFTPSPDQNLIDIAVRNGYYPISFLKIAAFFISIDMPDKALEFIKIAENISPDNYLVYNLKGVALAKQGKIKEALCEFTKASDKDKGNPEVFHNIGMLFLMSGENDIASRYFEEGLRVNPDSEKLKKALALVN